MLTRDVSLEGFSTTDWLRLFELARGRPARSSEGRRPSGGVVALTAGASLRKLVATDRGRLALADQPWPVSLEQLALQHDARWAASLHTGALEELVDRFAERLAPEHDLLEQMLTLLDVLRGLVEEEAIRVWPWRPARWPIPSAAMARRALDAVCPEGKVVAVAAFHEGEVYTSVAARRMGGAFDRIVGPDELRAEMGLVSGDWTRDYRHLARAISSRVGPLALGCFAELETFRALASDPVPGAWTAAVASRDVLLAPISPAVAVPLGLDVGRLALATMRDLAGRYGAADLFAPEGPFGPTLDRLRKATLGDRDVEQMLGFDPLDVLRRLLSRTRDTGE